MAPAPRPSLLVIVPGDWEVIPEGLAELKWCLSDEYGAVLLLRQATANLASPLALHTGYWPGNIQRYLWHDINIVGREA